MRSDDDLTILDIEEQIREIAEVVTDRPNMLGPASALLAIRYSRSDAEGHVQRIRLTDPYKHF